MNTLDELIAFCKEEEPVGALLLSGEWGCGKTYLIEHEFKEKVKDTTVVLRISLFGMMKIEEIHNAIKHAWLEEYCKLKGFSSVFDIVTKGKKILNKKVYPHIYVLSSEIVDESFHSRKSAISKEYRYYVSINTFDPLKVNYMHFFHDRIDISKIREAMKYIVGTHDFKSFSKNKTVKTTVRTIEEFELNIIDGVLEFRIKGTGFMYNMVRIIIAIMLKVAEGKLQPSDVLRIIDGKERTLAPWVAPASGLYLWKVYYE